MLESMHTPKVGLRGFAREHSERDSRAARLHFGCVRKTLRSEPALTSRRPPWPAIGRQTNRWEMDQVVAIRYCPLFAHKGGSHVIPAHEEIGSPRGPAGGPLFRHKKELTG